MPVTSVPLHPQIIPAHDSRLRQLSRPITADEAWFAQQTWYSLQTIMQQIEAYRPFRHAMGLSAIQIGVPLQLAVVWTPQLGFMPLANPQILGINGDDITMYESCFSCPDWHGQIARAPQITTRYWNEYLQPVEQKFSGWAARIIQHVVDHMHGVLFTDRLRAGENLLSDEDYLILKAAC